MMKVVAGCFETESEGRRHLESVENITVVSLDVRSEASVGAAVEVVTRLAGSEGLTALVNNAAVLVFGETMWQTEEQVSQTRGQDGTNDLIRRSDLRWRLIISVHFASVGLVSRFLWLQRFVTEK